MTALLDSNVMVASLVEGHPGHASSISLLGGQTAFHTAVHALSEVYSTLTKARHYAWEPRRAGAAVAEFDRRLKIAGLDTADQLRAIAEFAAQGGTGANLYDYLIGAAARRAGLARIVTFNLRHFTPYFPDLTILTPAQYLEML